MTLDTTLLDATQRITPVIRTHRAQAERERCLSAPVVEAMAEAGLWRLGIPRSLGGLEVDPLTCARVVEEVALADSVAGWALTNPMIFAWSCARCRTPGARPSSAAIPVYHVLASHSHQAIPCPGLSGHRPCPFISTCQNATWYTVGAGLAQGATAPGEAPLALVRSFSP
jgi:hypothetical protein